uniref:ubiquitinyl hydrolase 1 n=1 Tax=Crassostrea virginica TaxID=6565 RepID=A0A8B8ATK0_CRAVI|nr:uncharacterized protein LOC111104711 isoform X2 [Crassostrea virginica]
MAYNSDWRVSEMNACILCSSNQNCGKSEINPGLCLQCIRNLIENPYQCHVDSRMNDLNSLILMWRERSLGLFTEPYSGRLCDVCNEVPVMKIKQCKHSLCWDCSKRSVSKDRLLTRCPVVLCKSEFPTESVDYYLHQLKSTMRLALLFVRLKPSRGDMCWKCHRTSDQVYVEFRRCFHRVCQTCVNDIIRDHRADGSSIVSLFDSKVDVFECFEKECDNKIPLIFLKSMSLALNGNTIAVSMFLRLPRVNESGLCSTCEKEKNTTLDIKDKQTVRCRESICKVTPLLCLKTVTNSQIDKILQDNIENFDELNKRGENTDATNRREEESSTASSIRKVEGDEIDQQSRHQSVDPKLRPSYGIKMTCLSCKKMAVVKSEQCSNYWCVDCLKSQIRTRKDGFLKCGDSKCTSTTTMQYVNRFLRTCKTYGSLIPVYIEIIPGTSCCDCKRAAKAIFKAIECDHQFCKVCLKESKDYVFCCPKKDCNSTMDEESSTFLQQCINDKEEEMFMDRLSELKVDCECDSCKAITKKTNKGECGVRIRKCGHFICHHCYNKMRGEENNPTIAKCPANHCVGSFIFHSDQPTTNKDLEDTAAEQKDDSLEVQNSCKDLLNNPSVKDRSDKLTKTNRKKLNFTFQAMKENKGTREKGLPNLGSSCYRNAVYQILAESQGFFSALRSCNESVKEDWTFTLCEILWRISNEESYRGCIDYWLYRMGDEFSKIDNLFVEYRQNDCLSFFTSLLNGIKDEIQERRKQIGEDTITDPTAGFRGQLQDKFTCCKCKKMEFAEPFEFFSLPLPTVDKKDPKIGESLFQFLKAETIEGPLKCKQCHNEQFDKETKIKSFPEVLVLQLGVITELRYSQSKVRRSPKYWETFKGLTNSEHLTKVDTKEFSKYKLYGVIVHIGGMNSGHYYAYVKNLRTDEWELRDDSYVKKVDLETVFDCDAYILFYHKREKVTELP